MNRFDNKTLMALGAGLGAALIATFLFAMIDAFKQPVQMHEKVVELRVLKALKKIPEGAVLSPEMVEYTTVPVQNARLDLVVDPAQITNLKTVRPIAAEALLSKEDFQNPTATSIPRGYVAMSLQVDTVSGVTWMLKEGDAVDVIGVLRPTDSSDRRGNIATVELQAIRILSIESPKVKKEKQVSTTEKGTITLLMTPEQAQKLMLVSTAGNYSLALRGRGDDAEHTVTPLSVSELIASKKAAPKKNVRPRRAAVHSRLQVVEVK
jgi:pilus assembly protein CpaB